MRLFNKSLNSQRDWEDIHQSITAFTPLIEHILKKENLAVTEIENLPPGTNAVFKAGNYVIKIFAPVESNVEQRLPQTEILATQRANQLGIPVPKVIASGIIEDNYHFAYLITEYIDSVDIAALTDSEKIKLGHKLRSITEKMNTHCKPFQGINTLDVNGYYHCWDTYSKSFKKERLDYISTQTYGENVFIHSDLCGDNLLLTPHGDLYIIDFADAILAPKIYEHACLALDSGLDPMVLQGFFDNYTDDAFLKMCFNGLLILHYDPEMIEKLIGKPHKLHTLYDLRKVLGKNLKIKHK